MPDALDDLVLCDQPIPVLEQQDQQIQDLRLHRYGPAVPPHFEGVGVDKALIDAKDHRRCLIVSSGSTPANAAVTPSGRPCAGHREIAPSARPCTAPTS